MSITAKELAKILNLSAASVSVALNNKPGVSAITKKRILEAAHKYGYDFSTITKEGKLTGTIYYIRYINYHSPQEAPFFSYLASSLDKIITSKGYKYIGLKIYGDEDFDKNLEKIKFSDCAGILLLGTDITKDKLKRFLSLDFPLVLMDTWFTSPPVNCVKVNNIQGAYLATEYLIKKYKCQPGYLQSSLRLQNYEERFTGYCQALEKYRMSMRNSDINVILPNMYGAQADMNEIMQHKKQFARSYIADTDAQAVGAMMAFQTKGYKIPDDIAFIGFDNSFYSENAHPNLTTIEAYPSCMAATALNRLLSIISERNDIPIKIEISTSLIERGSA
ncbi:LacI family DNA-binding transcriptional regulator [Parablautia sp. Marseille-Q6255]|uniref:LacI family DNA-binding transcriptional regulator n=1 Tax=Parablautia sp. Marseille-Q6255 TaxID=3039593 RepID=UPI0024BC817D|nr:LacI family DNA-binding transcriptional regulator [Parablautia sp. Marseille-Q6255]